MRFYDRVKTIRPNTRPKISVTKFIIIHKLVVKYKVHLGKKGNDFSFLEQGKMMGSFISQHIPVTFNK